jgi:hypothetical protein
MARKNASRKSAKAVDVVGPPKWKDRKKAKPSLKRWSKEWFEWTNKLMDSLHEDLAKPDSVLTQERYDAILEAIDYWAYQKIIDAWTFYQHLRQIMGQPPTGLELKQVLGLQARQAQSQVTGPVVESTPPPPPPFSKPWDDSDSEASSGS